METKVGIVGVVLENPKVTEPQVEEVISRYASHITGKASVPYGDEFSTMALIVNMGTDALIDFTARLYDLEGVSVTSAFTPKTLS